MNNEELNRMLHTWRAEVELPPSFQREVWRRIETAVPARSTSAGWLELFLSWLSRPLPATVACALALAVGVTAAGLVETSPPVPVAVAYANSINPLAHTSKP